MEIPVVSLGIDSGFRSRPAAKVCDLDDLPFGYLKERMTLSHFWVKSIIAQAMTEALIESADSSSSGFEMQ